MQEPITVEPIIENPGITQGAEQAFGRWLADGLYRGLENHTLYSSTEKLTRKLTLNVLEHINSLKEKCR